jgi:signal transduction histidine kinase
VLIALNLGILIISGGLGYVLADRTLKPIKEMMEEQNRFIGNASHELRTPLTSLKSAFEVYLRDNQPSLPEAKKLVKESIDEVNKLQSLSESLLKLA